jgi:hypothetical protein
MTEIVNKVKQSKLETVDLEKFADGVTIYELDLKNFLFQGMILKEKEFREQTESHNWEQYKDAYLTVFCSTDAIIPKWAYMLIVQHAGEYAEDVLFGRREAAMAQIFNLKLDQFDWSRYADKFVLLKGCSKLDVPAEVYMHATKKLLPFAKKLMYGEACSNVPVYRKK